MPISIETCNDDDMERVYQIIHDAHQEVKPCIEGIYPQYLTRDTRAQGRDQLLQLKRTDSSARFIKAVDTKTGRILGQAIWLVLFEGPGEKSIEGEFWGDPDDREYTQLLIEQYRILRVKAFEAGNGRLLGTLISSLICALVHSADNWL